MSMSIGAPIEANAPTWLFQNLRWQLFRNALRTLYGQSLVRPVSILFACSVVWIFVFSISYAGFDFLQGSEFKLKLTTDFGPIPLLIDLLFLTLGFLLIFSNGLILYGSLFTTPETAFLLSKPVGADRVFAYKFQGALAFSSLAFVLLGSPILLAFGIVAQAYWYFYLLLPLFFLGYVLIPGSVGGILCLIIVNFFPRNRVQVLIALTSATILFFIWWIGSATLGRGDRTSAAWQREAVNVLLGRFAFASSVTMPSHWVQLGLLRGVQGKPDQGLYYLVLVWSNGLFFYLVTTWLAMKLYRRGFNRLSDTGVLERQSSAVRAANAAPRDALLDQLLGACFFFVQPATRLLIIKDFRTFRRDPQQSLQLVIFVGLMLLYITNIRRMFLLEITWFHQNSISLLTFFAISMLMCTYTGRFIFPMLSLEGRKFWVLGLLPVRRDQLLWGKFTFAITGAIVIAGPMILLSDWMLSMPWPAVALHIMAMGCLAAGLSGMSIGFGACMPNFRETDPSKIAVGFGGTLNLVAGLGYLLAVLVLFLGPWSVQMSFEASGDATISAWWVVWLGVFLGLALAAAAVVFPLRAGIRALRSMEF